MLDQESSVKISNLSRNSKNIELVGEIMEIKEPRNVNTRYGQSRVADAVISDDTGEISITIWGDDIDKVREGNKVRVKKAYTSEWNGKLQLNIGRFGKLVVLN